MSKIWVQVSARSQGELYKPKCAKASMPWSGTGSRLAFLTTLFFLALVSSLHREAAALPPWLQCCLEGQVPDGRIGVTNAGPQRALQPWASITQTSHTFLPTALTVRPHSPSPAKPGGWVRPWGQLPKSPVPGWVCTCALAARWGFATFAFRNWG